MFLCTIDDPTCREKHAESTGNGDVTYVDYADFELTTDGDSLHIAYPDQNAFLSLSFNDSFNPRSIQRIGVAAHEGDNTTAEESVWKFAADGGEFTSFKHLGAFLILEAPA